MRIISAFSRFQRRVFAVCVLVGISIVVVQPRLVQYVRGELDTSTVSVLPAQADSSTISLLPPQYPVVVRRPENTSLADPFVTAKAAVAMDVTSGALLYEQHAFESRPPASVTKLMTALVARDAYYLDQVLQTDLGAKSAGTVIDYSQGEEQTVRSLLKASLIQSGNDAAEVLAARYPGGSSAFVEAMNKRARDMGLESTFFENPSGLDSPQHTMSVRDISLVFAQALQDPFLRETLMESQAYVLDSSGTVGRTLHNTNQLLWAEYVLAGKTGTTEAAGQVLTTLVLVDGHEVIITVAGSDDRYTDTIALYRWLEQAYTWVDQDEFNLLH